MGEGGWGWRLCISKLRKLRAAPAPPPPQPSPIKGEESSPAERFAGDILGLERVGAGRSQLFERRAGEAGAGAAIISAAAGHLGREDQRPALQGCVERAGGI